MKFVIIQKCTDCLNNTTWLNLTSNERSYECRHPGSPKLGKRVSEDIPGWCPLADYRDVSDMEAEIEELEYQLKPRCA